MWCGVWCSFCIVRVQWCGYHIPAHIDVSRCCTMVLYFPRLIRYGTVGWRQKMHLFVAYERSSHYKKEKRSNSQEAEINNPPLRILHSDRLHMKRKFHYVSQTPWTLPILVSLHTGGWRMRRSIITSKPICRNGSFFFIFLFLFDSTQAHWLVPCRRKSRACLLAR